MILIRFASVPSTQDWARHWAQLGAPELLAVQALEQTAGRGRLSRSWWSPPGVGLYLSLLVRPSIPLSQAPQLTMLTAVAAMDACGEVAGITPRPKWPNDLLWQGRKLAGILTEIEQERGRLRYAVIGLGLN
ncbi:MAG: biotin--[acetyl-CoA-carboxylase] ligase, partial [Anaerolineae bacterium]|nr:biotin--[acetyl-CoA-carboxylase] ligase [Anaerolineae bacterium]